MMATYLRCFIFLVGASLSSATGLYAAVREPLAVPVEEMVTVYRREASKLSSDRIEFSVKTPVNVVDFDEIWADYSVQPGLEPAAMLLELNLSVSEPYTRRRADISAKALEARYLSMPSLEINAEDAEWVPKDRRFYWSRIVEDNPDGKWRYTTVGDILVAQFRLNVPLSGKEALDIYMKPDADVVGLNLNVSNSDRRWPGRTIESQILPAQDISDASGKFRRIGLSRLLEDQFSRVKNPCLKEISIFFRMRTGQILEDKPVKKILFQRLTYTLNLPRKKGTDLKMESRTQLLAGNRRRLIVQLEGAKAKGDALLTGGQIRLFYPSDGSLTGARIDTVSLILKRVPVSEAPPAAAQQQAVASPKVGASLQFRKIFLGGLPSAAAVLLVLFSAWGMRRLKPALDDKFPVFSRELFSEQHRVYFLLAGLALILTAALTLVGRGRVADPAAALTYVALAIGVFSLAKDLFLSER